VKVPDTKVMKKYREADHLTDGEMKEVAEFFTQMLAGARVLGPEYGLFATNLQHHADQTADFVRNRHSANRERYANHDSEA
jgi:hypothetical protein